MATDSGPRPTLVLNPPDDEEFRSAALDVIEDGADTPAALEQALRRRYPRVLVRPRDLVGERSQIWYVYRDGRWVRS